MPEPPALPSDAPRGRPLSGALLLCRADPDAVRPSAGLLPTPLLLAPAGEGWSVLLPAEPEEPPTAPLARGDADRPAPPDAGTDPERGGLGDAAGLVGAVARATGRGGTERRPPLADADALADLARTVAAGEPWPVIGVWWGPDGAGFTVATGFRRPLTFAWLADGAPAGDDEAASALIARLGLDPVLDGASLDELTRATPTSQAPDGSGATDGARPGAAGAAAGPNTVVQQRLVGLVAVLSRAGLRLPAGLTAGAPERRLHAALHAAPGAEVLVWRGWRDAVRAELNSLRDGPPGPWTRGPRVTAVCAAQLAVGLPLAVWGLRRHRPGWATLGALLAVDGAAGLVSGRARERSATRDAGGEAGCPGR
ncbi:hypothetical protein [Streptomyces sp. NPDC057702]|uniref:hypothetical protein n=1 Tax=unclassified Streptomyces TaxID=2593676 RepID=UPI00367B0212